MQIFNARPVSEIQKEREIEAKGTDQDKLRYLLEVAESNTNLVNDSIAETSMVIGEISTEMANAMAEITMLIGTLTGGSN